MQVSLRASAYGGVRAVLVVPSEMITDEPGVGLAHGIGATSVPRPVDALPGPERTPKRRRPTSPRVPAAVSLGTTSRRSPSGPRAGCRSAAAG
ncbi:hypothetical protein GCM10023238_10440 [Streptomyces heliomycini]